MFVIAKYLTATKVEVCDRPGAECVLKPLELEQLMRQLRDEMDRSDLDEVDVKSINYSIVFTKSDFEAVLEQRDELLGFLSADAAKLGALKVGEFLSR